jgi:hypothetical protein
MKGHQYYAERLLSQAIEDPAIDEADSEAVRAYIKDEAAALCIEPEPVVRYAMRGYEMIVNNPIP